MTNVNFMALLQSYTVWESDPNADSDRRPYVVHGVDEALAFARVLVENGSTVTIEEGAYVDHDLSEALAGFDDEPQEGGFKLPDYRDLVENATDSPDSIEYPHRDGPFQILGPGIFTNAHDDSVISVFGRNYVPQNENPGEVCEDRDCPICQDLFPEDKDDFKLPDLREDSPYFNSQGAYTGPVDGLNPVEGFGEEDAYTPAELVEALGAEKQCGNPDCACNASVSSFLTDEDLDAAEDKAYGPEEQIRLLPDGPLVTLSEAEVFGFPIIVVDVVEITEAPDNIGKVREEVEAFYRRDVSDDERHQGLSDPLG